MSVQSRHEIQIQFNTMREKLDETLDDAQHTRSPLSDALRVVIPMMQDQLKLMEALFVEVGSHEHYDLSGGR